MRIAIDSKVFELAPQFVRYVLLVDNIDNNGEDEKLLALLRQEEKNVRDNPQLDDSKNHPRIAAWRELFSAFNVNPNRCPPSIANLIKRVKNGKDLPFVNKLVCIFNIISLRHMIPAGGDDLDSVTGDILLCPAKGNETYIPLGAKDDSTIEHPTENEIILMDSGSNTVLCRAWCWKNGDTTKIQPSSKRTAINLDILPPLPTAEGELLAQSAKQLIEEHCGATVSLHRLDKENTELVAPA